MQSGSFKEGSGRKCKEKGGRKGGGRERKYPSEMDAVGRKSTLVPYINAVVQSAKRSFSSSFNFGELRSTKIQKEITSKSNPTACTILSNSQRKLPFQASEASLLSHSSEADISSRNLFHEFVVLKNQFLSFI